MNSNSYFNLMEYGFSLLEISGYIDPGSFSAIMAVIIGGIVGTGMTFKLYWYKIKHKFSKD